MSALLSGSYSRGGQCHNWTVDLLVSMTLHQPVHSSLAGSLLSYRQAVRTPSHTSPGLQGTHRIEEHSEEELAPIDDLVQLTGASGVLIVEDGMREEATGLPREDLRRSKSRAMLSPWSRKLGCFLRRKAGASLEDALL